MQLLSMAGLLGVVTASDRAARRGDYAATKRLILPVYHRIVYALVTFDFLSVVMVVFRLDSKEGKAGDADIVVGKDEDYLVDVKSLFIGADWAILHWVVDGVAVFLRQPSAGQQAMWRAVGLGLLPALGSFAMGYLKHRATKMPNDPCVLDQPDLHRGHVLIEARVLLCADGVPGAAAATAGLRAGVARARSRQVARCGSSNGPTAARLPSLTSGSGRSSGC